MTFFKTFPGSIIGLYFCISIVSLQCTWWLFLARNNEDDFWNDEGMPPMTIKAGLLNAFWMITLVPICVISLIHVVDCPIQSAPGGVPLQLDLFMRLVVSALVILLTLGIFIQALRNSDKTKRAIKLSVFGVLAITCLCISVAAYPWIPRRSVWWAPNLTIIWTIFTVTVIFGGLKRRKDSRNF